MTAHRISLSQIAEQQGDTMNELQEQLNRTYPPPVFWIALLAFRNHALEKLREDFFRDLLEHAPEGTFGNAINVIDGFLDRGLVDGWENGYWGYPADLFWKELLIFRNYAIARLGDDYIKDVLILPNKQKLQHSVNVVDDFIETALEQGWMDEIAN